MTLRLLPYSPERDAYRLLGIPPNASIEEIGVACRRLALTFHPDHNASPRATEEMQVVNAVRRVMTDPSWRATYDRERRRFHAERVRSTAEREASLQAALAELNVHVAPLRLEARPASAIVRYARALAIGLRAAAEGLLPARCRRCRTVLDGYDAYCGACGTRLLGAAG